MVLLMKLRDIYFMPSLTTLTDGNIFVKKSPIHIGINETISAATKVITISIGSLIERSLKITSINVTQMEHTRMAMPISLVANGKKSLC
jgi:hypothetical protein